MRSTWKRALSTLLTLAMLATLLVVPAGATLATGDASAGVYVLDCTSDLSSLTLAAGSTVPAGTDNYFGVNAGSVSKTKYGAVGTESDDYYIAAASASTSTWSTGGKLNTTTVDGTKTVQRYIQITTKNDNALIKLWWYNSSTSAARNAIITKAVETEGTVPDTLYTSTVNTGAGGSYDTYTVATANTTVLISADASIYFIRIEVVDKAADPSITLGETTAQVQANSTATVTATVANYDGAVTVTSSADNIATGTYTDDVVTITGVAEGTATLTVTAGTATAEIAVTVVAAGAHVHTYSDWTTETPGTCTTAAVLVRTCTDGNCTDENKGKETKEGEKDPSNHPTESVETVAAVAATCTTDGKTEGKTCTACNTVILAQEAVARTGHTFSTGTIGEKCQNCDVTMPDHLDIMFGESGSSSDNAPTEAEKGYITAYVGGGTGSSYGATYTKVDGTSVELSNGHTKFDSSGLLTFKVPGTGTLTFCFDADQGTNIKVNDEAKTWDSTTGLLVIENVTAGSTYTLKQGSGQARLFAIGWKSSSYVVKRSVSYSLTNITTPTTTEVEDQGELSVTLTANSGYTLPDAITVTMGGTTLESGTGYTYDNSTGTVTVASVTGDVTITATAVLIPKTMTVTVTAPTELTYNGQAKTVTVTAKEGEDEIAAKNLTITYATEETGSYTATQPEMKNAGSYTVYVKVTADGYNEGTGSVTFAITKADCPALTVNAGSEALGAAGGDVTVTVSGLPEDADTSTNAVVITCENATVSGTTVTLPKNEGDADVSYTIKANWAGDDNYNAASEASTTVTVHPAGAIVLTADKDAENTVTEVTEGGTLKFAVTASAHVSGDESDAITPTYQWKVDGTEIEGATEAAYTITTAALSDSGKVYSCVVTAAKEGSTAATKTVTFDATKVNEETKTITFTTDTGVEALDIKVDNATADPLQDNALTVAKSAVVTFVVRLKENYAIKTVTGAEKQGADDTYTVTADAVTITTEEVTVVDPDTPVETTMQFVVESKHAVTYAEETKVETGVVGVELWLGGDTYDYKEPADGDNADYAGSIQGQTNPTPKPSASGVPTTGCYYKFVVTQDGTLTVDTKAHSDGKPIYINKVVDGTTTNVKTDSSSVKGKPYQDTLEVKAGETYYFAMNGSKLGFYGFSFTTMLKPADVPETAAVDKDALTAAIAAATAASEDTTYTVAADAAAVETLEGGTYYVMKADHDELVSAIAKAQTIADAKLATQDQVDAAVESLTNAVKAFDAAKQIKATVVDKTELEAAIAAAETKSNVYEVENDVTAADVVVGKPFVTKAAKAAYVAAIAAAQAVVDDETATQTDVNKAVEDLAAATQTFEGAIQVGTKPATKDDLTAAITEANEAKEGIVTGTTEAEVDKGTNFVTEAEMKALDDAIAAAQAVVDKETATDTEIYEATEALHTAVKAFQDAIKTGTKTEVETVNKDALNASVAAAEAAAQTATVSADGTDVATIAKWVTEAEMKALTDAIATAKGVVEKAAATQTEVDAAKTTLDAAVTTFEAAKKDGTKTEVETVNKDALNASVAAAEAAAQTATVSVDGTDVATTAKWVTEAEMKALTDAIAAAKDVAAKTDATQDEVDAAKATLDAAVTTFEAAKKDGTKTEDETVNKDALNASVTAAEAAAQTATVSADGTDVATTAKWVTEAEMKALTDAIAAAKDVVDKEAATQTEVDAAKAAMDAAVTTFEAAKKDGTKTDEPSGEADKKALTDAIAAATDAKKDISVNAGPASNVTKGAKFVSQAVMDALDEAIKTAQAVADKEDATAEEITKAVSDLNAAVKTFNAAVETGTKTTTSGRPSSSRTDRGETVTTTTKTTRNDDGSVVKTVTTSDGAVDITVTDAEGNVTIQVKLPATVPTVFGFTDVPNGHWAEKAINEMAGLELVKGVDEVNRIYDMASPITRGSIASIIFRFSQGETGLENIFTDVAEGQWYTDSVAWANKVGVVTGYEDGTFGPNNSITREQLATMLYRYAKLLGLDVSTKGSLSKFDDGSAVQSWATEAMSWAVGAGIILGRGDGTVDPAASATRAEAAVMLQRFIDLVR